jgi:hypothetical protein
MTFSQSNPCLHKWMVKRYNGRSQPGVNGNVNVFNLDAFLTWDFRLGSKMVVGYKNWLGDNESINGVSKRYYLNNLTQTFDESHGNELTVRFIYFLDYNQLRRKK